MNPATLKHTTRLIALLALPLVALAYYMGGEVVARGAFIGALVALANWWMFQWSAARIVAAGDRGRNTIMMFLVLKMTALLAGVGLLLYTGAVDPLGFAIGVSALVLGLLLSGVREALQPLPVGEDA